LNLHEKVYEKITFRNYELRVCWLLTSLGKYSLWYFLFAHENVLSN